MYLVVGPDTSRAVWDSIEKALASSSRACVLNLLSQLQRLRHGVAIVTKYLGKTQVLVEELTLVGRPISLDEQNLYTFQGCNRSFGLSFRR